MRIAIIRHSLRNRGGDKLTLDYCDDLIAQGHEIEYWTREVKTSFSVNPKIHIKKLPWMGIPGTIFFALFTKFQGDVIIVDLVLMACLARARNKNKVLYLAQDYDVSYYRFFLLRKMTNFCYHLALGKLGIPTVAVSKHLEEIFMRYVPRQITTIHNGIDPALYCRNPHSEYLGRRTRAHVIVVFARDDHRKGWDIARKAIQKFSEIHPENDWEIWVIGTAKINLKVENATSFGFLKSDLELRDILSAADVFLSASRHEGFGLMQLQAMSCGCALVTTAAFTLADDHGALISPVDDVRALAFNLKRVVEDKTLRDRLRAGGEKVARQYDWSISKKEFEKFLLEHFPVEQSFQKVNN